MEELIINNLEMKPTKKKMDIKKGGMVKRTIMKEPNQGNKVKGIQTKQI